MLLAWVIPVTAPGRAGPAVGISPAAKMQVVPAFQVQIL